MDLVNSEWAYELVITPADIEPLRSSFFDGLTVYVSHPFYGLIELDELDSIDLESEPD